MTFMAVNKNSLSILEKPEYIYVKHTKWKQHEVLPFPLK